MSLRSELGGFYLIFITCMSGGSYRRRFATVAVPSDARVTSIEHSYFPLGFATLSYVYRVDLTIEPFELLKD